MKLNQDYDEVIHTLGIVYEFLGEREMAIEILIRYLKMHPDDNFELERLDDLKTAKSTSLGLANRISKTELKLMFQERFNLT